MGAPLQPITRCDLLLDPVTAGFVPVPVKDDGMVPVPVTPGIGLGLTAIGGTVTFPYPENPGPYVGTGTFGWLPSGLGVQ